jgi:hypothetical protein
MKPFFTLVLAWGFAWNAKAQQELKLSDANKHIGDTVFFVSHITAVKYFPKVKGEPTLIYLGNPYPNPLITLIIAQDVRNKIKLNLSEDSINGKMVHVKGRVEASKGKPIIVIRNPSQLQIVDGVRIFATNQRRLKQRKNG